MVREPTMSATFAGVVASRLFGMGASMFSL